MKICAVLLLSACLFGQTQPTNSALFLGSVDAPATPVDSPGAGSYGSTQSVTITDSSAQFILYTTNGSTPSCPATGTLYSGAFNISVTTTLKAVGCNGITGGGVLTSVYTITGGGGSPALINHGTATGLNTFSTSAINMTGANFLVLSVSYLTSSGVPAISDSSSNTWTALTAYASGGGAFSTKIFYAQNATVSSTQTFTAAGSTIAASLFVMGFSNMLTSSVFQSGTDVGTNLALSSTIQPGSITPSGSTVVITNIGANSSAFMSIDSSFIKTDSQSFSGGAHYAGAFAYVIQASGSTVNPTWTWSASTALASGIAAFKGM